MRKSVIGTLASVGAALLLALGPSGVAMAAPQPPVELLPPVVVDDASSVVAGSPDGSLVYVYERYNGALSIIDAATNTPVRPPVPVTTHIGFPPIAMLVHPDGRVLILDPGDGTSADPAVIEVDPTTWATYRHSFTAPVPVLGAGWGISMALTPSGDKLYVSDLQNGLIIAADVPAAAGPAPWDLTAIALTVETGMMPYSITVSGDYLYAIDGTGESVGGPARIAVIRTADDALLPDVIEYTAPAGTTGGIHNFPLILSDPAGGPLLVIATAELDDGSGDWASYFWSIPAGTMPATPTYLGPAPGGEVAGVTLAPGGATAYLLDCACAASASTLDLASGAITALDLGAASDLDAISAMAVSADGTRILLIGDDPLGDTLLWQLGTVADDALTVTGPTTVEQGGSVTLRAAGTDNSGNPIDLTGLVTLSSDVPTDVIDGNVVTFPHASPHTITATYAAGGSTVASGALTVQVAALLPPTGPTDPRPAVAVAVALLAAGAALLAVGVRARLRRAR